MCRLHAGAPTCTSGVLWVRSRGPPPPAAPRPPPPPPPPPGPTTTLTHTPPPPPPSPQTHTTTTTTTAAGIPWLIERFKQYVVLRDRLFSDTSVLRGKLSDALPGEAAGWVVRRGRAERWAGRRRQRCAFSHTLWPRPWQSSALCGAATRFSPCILQAHHLLFKFYLCVPLASFADPEAIRSASGGNNSGLAAPNSVGALGPTNANGPGTGARSVMASRFAAVMEYKMQRQGRAAAAAGAQQAQQSQQAEAAGEPPEESPAAVDQLASKVLASQAPARVRLAMQAAMEDRQKKAAATKAAADAAAAAARTASSSSAAVRAARLTSAGMLAGAPPPAGLSSMQPLAAGEAAAAAAAAVAAAAQPAAIEATSALKATAPAQTVAPAAVTLEGEAAEAAPANGVVAAAGALG